MAAAAAAPPVLRVDPADLPAVVPGPGVSEENEDVVVVEAAAGDKASGNGAAAAASAAAAARDAADPWWRLRYPLPDELRVDDGAGGEGEGDGEAAVATANGNESNGNTNNNTSAAAVRRAARLLRAGLPVALPTETVYGLACDATRADAAARVFAAKGRPQDNPLIVHVSSVEMLLSLYPPRAADADSADATTPPEEETEAQALARVLRPPNDALARAFWPGPLTLLLPASPLIPSAVTAGHATVAVRMPSHPVARAVIAAAGAPVAAPSANVSGRPSPTEAAHVAEDYAACGRGGMVPLVLDGGACACGVESTVAQARGWEEEDQEEGAAALAAATPGGGGDKPRPRRRGRRDVVVLRPGGVTPEQIDRALAREYGAEGGAAGAAATDALPSPPSAAASSSNPSVVVYGLSAGAERDVAFEAAPTTPGMKYRHYSPDAPVLLVEPPPGLGASEGGGGEARWRATTTRAVLGAARALELPPGTCQTPLTVVLLRTTLPQGAPEGWQQQQQQQQQEEDGLLLSSAALASAGVGRVLTYNLGPWRAPERVARRLFAGLRAADAVVGGDGGGAVVIVAEGVPSGGGGVSGGSGSMGVGVAVMNRLRKAAARVVVAAEEDA
jgi:L-threonylcarbamoyladenylate synthase